MQSSLAVLFVMVAICSGQIFQDAAKRPVGLKTDLLEPTIDALQLEESCLTKEGIEGKCAPEFECPYFQGFGKNAQKTVCHNRLFIPFYCCPPNSPIKTNPIDKLRVSGCGLRSINLGTELLARAKRSELQFPTKEIGPVTHVPTVVGGDPAIKHSWPWMTAIYQKEGSITNFLCGGAIINKRYILTAAHCFKVGRNTKINPKDYIVRLAEHNLEDTNLGDQYEVESVIVHANYAPPVDYNDIALLKLKRTISFNNKVSPICLPVDHKDDKFEADTVTVIGWGVTNFAGIESHILQQVDVPVTSNAKCHQSYKRFVRDYPKGIVETQLCAGVSGKDACQGDSGGPLMVQKNGKWNIVGVVSGGFQCARAGFPGIYSRTTSYLPWIAQNLN